MTFIQTSLLAGSGFTSRWDFHFSDNVNVMPPSSNWIERLSSEGETRDAALLQLRHLLVRGIQKSFADRGADNAFAEDVAQEALLRILASLDSFEGRSRFTTWAMAVAVRTAISQLRHKHFQDVSLEQVIRGETHQLDFADSESSTVAELFDKQALYNELRRRIETDLTTRQQTVIQALLGGMPIETIAEKIGTNRNAVYKMMHDARVKLKHGFESSGVSSEDIHGILAGEYAP